MKKIKPEILIFGAVIIILLAIVFYAAGQGAFGRKRPKLELSETGGGVATTDDGNIDTARYDFIAESIYSSLSGWNFSSEGMQAVYNLIMKKTENELRLIVNSYDKIYGTDEYYPTIRALLDGEFLSCGSWYNFGYVSTACTQKREIQAKLSTIGA